MVRRAAGVRVHRDGAPVRVGAVAADPKIQVGAGSRIEEQIHVVDNVLLERTPAVHVVGFDGHRVAELPLEADRGVPGARQLDVLRNGVKFPDVTDETAGRIVVQVAVQRDRLIVARQGPAVGRVRREIRAAIILVPKLSNLGIADRRRLIALMSRRSRDLSHRGSPSDRSAGTQSRAVAARCCSHRDGRRPGTAGS